jgi:hypothetical protein
LGWSLTDEQRAAVLEHSSFAWMKANAARFTRMEAGGPSAFKPGGFIRKGAIGDHKTLLSPQQETRILGEARRMLEPACLRFLGL